MQPVTIRPAAEQDAATITALMTVLGYSSPEIDVKRRIAEHAASANSIVLVAESASHVVGVLSFHCAPMFHANGCLGRITSVVINPHHQQQGIGRALVAAAEDFGWAHGCTRIEVTSGDHRADAHAFYERLGYHCDCRRFIKNASIT